MSLQYQNSNCSDNRFKVTVYPGALPLNFIDNKVKPYSVLECSEQVLNLHMYATVVLKAHKTEHRSSVNLTFHTQNTSQLDVSGSNWISIGHLLHYKTVPSNSDDSLVFEEFQSRGDLSTISTHSFDKKHNHPKAWMNISSYAQFSITNGNILFYLV